MKRGIIILLVGFSAVSLLTSCTNWEKKYRAYERKYSASEKKYKALEKMYTSKLHYQITDLGSLPASNFPIAFRRGHRCDTKFPEVSLKTPIRGEYWKKNSRACSISDNGQIVGKSYIILRTYTSSLLHGQPVGGYSEYNCSRACLFDPSGQNTDLETLGGDQSLAYSINSNGQIVGFAYTSSGDWHACLFDPNRENIDLGTLGGKSIAYSISDNGQIVGEAGNACLFNPYGPNIDLGTLGGGKSEAYSINDSGHIVGCADISSDGEAHHACLFDPTGGGNNTDLGTLGGEESTAYSINNNGQIVGRADTSQFEHWAYTSSGNYHFHACLFDPTGAGNNTDLGTLGGNYSWANCINDNGQIVGWADISIHFGGPHACFFDPTGSGANIDLNMLLPESSGWVLTDAKSINNKGWIVGEGINPSGEKHAYLLTPRSNQQP